MKLLPRVLASVGFLALVVLAGCASSPFEPAPTATTAATPATTAAPVCAGHRHATFAVVLPTGPEGGLQVLNLSEPRHSSGHAYYQLGLAANMSIAVHMHQAGGEAGNASLQVTQMHYESPSACATVAQSLAAIDVTSPETADQLTVGGRHAAKGEYEATSERPLGVYLQTQTPGTCAWDWRLVDGSEGLAHVVLNGESFLVVVGAPSTDEVQTLQASIPPPMGRSASC